jgi:hypothetical protein
MWAHLGVDNVTSSKSTEHHGRGDDMFGSARCDEVEQPHEGGLDGSKNLGNVATCHGIDGMLGADLAG